MIRKTVSFLLALCMCILPIFSLVACDEDSNPPEDLTLKITFPSATFTYDGEPKSLAIEGELPEGVTVTYEGNGQTEVGVYEVTATFADSTGKYTLPEPMKATLTIVLPSIKGISFTDVTVPYDTKKHNIFIKGTLPDGVTVSYEGNGRRDIGTYTVTATFADSTGKYSLPKPMKATLTILDSLGQSGGAGKKDQFLRQTDSLPDLNYGGDTIKVLCREDCEYSAEFNIEQISADNISMAIYDRNREIKERLGIELDFKELPSGGAHSEAFVQWVSAAYATKSSSYDLIAADQHTQGILARRGYLQDLNAIDESYINLTKPYWPDGRVDGFMTQEELELQHQFRPEIKSASVDPASNGFHSDFQNPNRPYSIAQDLAIGDALYYLTGDISPNMLFGMNVLFFNKQLLSAQYDQTAQQQGYTAKFDGQNRQIYSAAEAMIYHDVYKGTWTLDKLITMTADHSSTYGLCGANGFADAYYVGAGLRLVERDETELLKISDDFGSAKAIALTEKLGEWLGSDHCYIAARESRPFDSFVTGQSLFAQSILNNRYYNDFGMGVLPMPKYTAEQDRYLTAVESSYILYGIYADCADRGNKQETLTMLTAVLECWASESYRLVTPQIFEVSLQKKYMEFEFDTYMFEIIRSTVTFDSGNIYGEVLGHISDDFSNAAEQNADWEQVYGEYGTSLTDKLAAVIRDFTVPASE